MDDDAVGRWLPLGLACSSEPVGLSADVPQLQCAAGLGERFGDEGGAVVAHHTAALNPLAVEPGDCTAITVFFCSSARALDVFQLRGAINSDMLLGVAHAVGTTALPDYGDPVPHLLESCKGLDVDVDQLTRPFPLEPLHRRFGMEIARAPEPQRAEQPGDG